MLNTSATLPTWAVAFVGKFIFNHSAFKVIISSNIVSKSFSTKILLRNALIAVPLYFTPTVVKDSILAIGVTKVYHHGFDN
jgi:uncharacterized protein YpmS